MLSLSIIKIYKKMAVEMFNAPSGLGPEIVNELFLFREQMN